MAKTLYKARIKHRKDTTANWNSKNPILLDGEFGFEVLANGSGKFKVGDGITAWVNLPYLPMPLDNDSHVYLDGVKAAAASSASTATAKASIATTKATEASSSASSALASKNAAASSANLASSQASIAATKAAASASSATFAATSASTATQKASEAGSYATNAANSAKQAAQSAAQSDIGTHNTDASAHRNLKAVDADKADGVTVTNLGDFKGKTIGELKAALKNWVMSSNSVFKVCRFAGVSTNSIINWDLENTIITDGIVWTATTIAANSYKTYNRILISSYATPLFVAILSSGEWLKLLEIPLKGNLISSINGVSTVNGGAVDLSSVFLKLSGGTLTGTLKLNKINTCSNAEALELCGGNGAYSNRVGSGFILYGKDASNNLAGRFYLYATDGVNFKDLSGYPNGVLVWDNKHIVRSVNNINADVAGNVTVPLGYLPLTGGAMSGGIINKTANTGVLEINGGAGSWSTKQGGGVIVYGKEVQNNYLVGGFLLYSTDGTDRHQLAGTQNGALKWDNKEIERINSFNSNCIRFESGLQICSTNSLDCNATAISWTFPMPFVVDPVVVASCSAKNTKVGVYSITKTKVDIQIDSTGGRIRAVAIGRWK